MTEIRNRCTGEIMLSGEGSLKELAMANKADLSYADLSRADLSYANLRYADLRSANLSDANLSYADLSRADLSGAKLSDAGLSDAVMPGFTDKKPQNLREAAELTKEWLRDGHWLQDKWIDTPTSAYAGDCLACLHGAAVYCSGEFGPQLSKAMTNSGYTVEWNDQSGRTIEEIVEAIDKVIPTLEAN